MKIPRLVNDASCFLTELQTLLTGDPIQEITMEELEAISSSFHALLLDFEHQAMLHCGDKDVAIDASYLLCTFADEKLVKHLGLRWKQCSLLVRQHNDAHGGELAWTRLDELLQLPQAAINRAQSELMGLYELVIKQGFQGMYELYPDGDARIKKICEQLHFHLYGSEATDAYISELIDLAHEKRDRLDSNMLIILAVCLVVILACILMFIHFYISIRWNQISSGTL